MDLKDRLREIRRASSQELKFETRGHEDRFPRGWSSASYLADSVSLLNGFAG